MPFAAGSRGNTTGSVEQVRLFPAELNTPGLLRNESSTYFPPPNQRRVIPTVGWAHHQTGDRPPFPHSSPIPKCQEGEQPGTDHVFRVSRAHCLALPRSIHLLSGNRGLS